MRLMFPVIGNDLLHCFYSALVTLHFFFQGKFIRGFDANGD